MVYRSTSSEFNYLLCTIIRMQHEKLHKLKLEFTLRENNDIEIVISQNQKL